MTVQLDLQVHCSTKSKKVKCAMPLEECGGVLVSLSWAWSHRWINHLNLEICDAVWCHTSSGVPVWCHTYGYLPTIGHHSHLIDTKLYDLVTKARLNNLLKVVSWKWNGESLKLQPLSHESGGLAVTPPATQYEIWHTVSWATNHMHSCPPDSSHAPTILTNLLTREKILCYQKSKINLHKSLKLTDYDKFYYIP